MKTNVLFFILVCSLSLSVTPLKAQYNYEQKPLRLGIETGLGLAAKSSPYGYGFSLNGQIKYTASPELTLIASLGYTGLLTKDTSPIPDYHFLPLKATVKIFPVVEQIYISTTVGAGFGVLKDSKTAFIFGGGLGYEWLTGYDLGLKYEAYKQSKSSATYQPVNGQLILAFTYYF